MAEIGKNNSENFLPEDIFADVESDYHNSAIRKQDASPLADSTVANIDNKKREKFYIDTNKNKANKKYILFVLFFVVFICFAYIFMNILLGLNKNKYLNVVKNNNSSLVKSNTESQSQDMQTQKDSSSNVLSDSVIKDSDKDGLYDIEEVKLFTSIDNPDTDGDDVSDGDEVKKYKTSPLNADTDGDGVSDYDEIFIYTTNSLSSDTDGDGFRDMDEINNGYNPVGQGKYTAEYLISIDSAKKIREQKIVDGSILNLTK